MQVLGAWLILVSTAVAAEGGAPASSRVLRQLEAAVDGELRPLAPGALLVLTEGVFVLEPRPEDPPPPQEPEQTKSDSDDAPPEAGPGRGALLVDLDDPVGFTAVELTCDDGTRERAAVHVGRARFSAAPVAPDAGCVATFKHPMGLSRAPVVGGAAYRCRVVGGFARCQASEEVP